MAKDEDVEISFDFSKVVKTMVKHKTAISLLILIGIFYLSLSVRLATVDEPYLLAADPHYWYRMTKNLVEGDAGIDYLRTYPEPHGFNHGFLPYFAAYSFKLANALTGIEFYRFLFWFPAIIAALSVFPAFLIGKELYSNKAGLFTAFFIGLTPSFISRSLAGFFDTDCMNILLSLVIISLFLAAYNRVDVNNIRKKSPIILSLLSGIFLAAFALNWSGGFAYVPWLFIGLFGFHWFYRILIAKGDNITEKLKHSWFFFRGHLLVYVILFATFFCFTFPFQGLGPVNSIIAVTSFFQTAKAEGGIFPNVWISISEEMSASLESIIGRVTPPIFFLSFFGLSILFMLFLRNVISYDKYENSYGTAFVGFLIFFLSFFLISLSTIYPLIAFLFSVSGILFGLVIKNKKFYPETFFFLFVWIVPTLYGSFWAVRFTQMLALPMSICAGIALGILFDVCINAVKKYGK